MTKRFVAVKGRIYRVEEGSSWSVLTHAEVATILNAAVELSYARANSSPKTVPLMRKLEKLLGSSGNNSIQPRKEAK